MKVLLRKLVVIFCSLCIVSSHFTKYDQKYVDRKSWSISESVKGKRYFVEKKYPIVNTVKLGYNEQLRTDQICSLQPGFVITGLIDVLNGVLEQNILFVITECLL